MFESKYGKVLTVILVIVIIAIIGLLVFLGIDLYNKYVKNKDAGNFVDDFVGSIGDDNNDDNINDGDLEGVADVDANSNGKKLYKGYVVMGTIEIPKTKVKYPILEKVTNKSIEVLLLIMASLL